MAQLEAGSCLQPFASGLRTREEIQVRVLLNVERMKNKYGAAANDILKAAMDLGPEVNVSGLTCTAIQAKIASLPTTDSVLLVGGYDHVPAFVLANPTAHVEGSAGDKDIPTDAPYGANPGSRAQQLVPTRVVARIPDGPAAASGQEFLAVLQSAKVATSTPAGCFNEAALEFAKPATDVAIVMGGVAQLIDSPPATDGDSDVAARLRSKGRLHVLLHGANFPSGWSLLYGHAPGGTAWPEGLSATILKRAELVGSVATFSSCYAAMIDLDASGHPVRDADNQVALACLRAGAKAVFAATRSNWINSGSGDVLGPGLMKRVWEGLEAGKTAGQALIAAKRDLAKSAMQGPFATKQDLPYVHKTLLQSQIYGNPDACL
jgi:hypothetical protein